MAIFRQQKNKLFAILSQPSWQEKVVAELNSTENLSEYIAPFLSFLLKNEVRWQAIWSFGFTLGLIAKTDKEQARNIMRRLMWSMNEESGNIGWGIPESMGATFAQSDFLASEYAKILFSYATSTGGEDNFIDHEPLRLGVYWGIAYSAPHLPNFVDKSIQTLTAGLKEEIITAKGTAAWGLTKMLQNSHIKTAILALPQSVLADLKQELANLAKLPPQTVQIFDGQKENVFTTTSLAQQALDLLG